MSTAAAPATGGGGRKLIVWIFWGSALVLAAVYGHSKYADLRTRIEDEKTAVTQKAVEYAKTNPPARSQAPVSFTDALVLDHECLTPCSTNIAWKFQIRVVGSFALRIKFQGVADWVDYPAGEGDFHAPEKMQSGETFFASPDKKPPVRVQVYRVISVTR